MIRRYNERSRRDEFLGFGKKKKADTKLSWDKASKIVKKALEDGAKRHRNIDWANHGEAEISRINSYVTINSLTGAWIQYLDGGHVICAAPDVDDKKFECPIEDGEVKGLGKVFDYFDRLDQKQGMINAEKNKKYRKESKSVECSVNESASDIDEATDKDEKLSDKKIKKMKKDFGSFIWWDMVTAGWNEYTVYATGHCLVVSQDKELRSEVEKVDPEQKVQRLFEPRIIGLIESCDSGNGKDGWEDIGLTIEAIKGGEKEKDVRTRGNRLSFDYKGNKVMLLNNNFMDFLRMFSGSVTGKTPVWYNPEMDAIGLKYKDEYGLLMTMG